jgi:hypothetical protein
VAGGNIWLFFVFEADNAPGAISGAKSVSLAFAFINNQQAHFFPFVEKYNKNLCQK